MRIDIVTEANLPLAAQVHAASWQASHRSFCRADFVQAHTPERQARYLLDKMRQGARVWLLTDGRPVGVVSVTLSLIEDLYVLPECQSRGYGTRLLRFAMEQCAETPTLWILSNNSGARRLYERLGFRPTGRLHSLSETLNEIEFALTAGENA